MPIFWISEKKIKTTMNRIITGIIVTLLILLVVALVVVAVLYNNQKQKNDEAHSRSQHSMPPLPPVFAVNNKPIVEDENILIIAVDETIPDENPVQYRVKTDPSSCRRYKIKTATSWLRIAGQFITEQDHLPVMILLDPSLTDAPADDLIKRVHTTPACQVHEGAVWISANDIFTYVAHVRFGGHQEWPLMLPAPLTRPPSSVLVTPPRDKSTETTSEVSSIIHQTWKSQQKLTSGHRRCIDLLIRQNPSLSHWFWDDSTCYEFVRNHFDPRITALYRDLVPGAFKADVWRLCVLHAFGGVYMDIDMTPKQSLVDNWTNQWPSQSLFVVQDDVTSTPADHMYLYNALIASSPKHDMLRVALCRTLTNASAYRRGTYTPLNGVCVTGPGSFGRAFEDFGGDRASVAAMVVENAEARRLGEDRIVRCTRTAKSLAATKYAGHDSTHTSDESGSYEKMFRERTWLDVTSRPNSAYSMLNTILQRSFVYDVIMYNGEIDILKLRLNTLKDVVDRVIVVESEYTFSGRKKALTFPDADIDPSALANVTYITLTDNDATLDGMQRDFWQKHHAFKKAVRVCGIRDDDFVLFSDVDEIPDPVVLRDSVRHQEPVIFNPHWFHFNFSNYIGTWENKQCGIASLAKYRSLMVNTDDLYSIHTLRSDKSIAISQSGWHASYFMPVEKVVQKLRQYGHANDRKDKNLLSAGPSAIRRRVQQGGELFRYKGRDRSQNFMHSFPSHTPVHLFGDFPQCKIPKIVITIWIGGGAPVPTQIFDRLMVMSPGFKHVHIDDAVAERMLKRQPRHVRDVYDAMHENKYRADLLRFLYLRDHGGYYVDIDTELVRPLNVFVRHENVQLYSVLCLARDRNMCIGTIFATPKHPIIDRILGRMLEIGNKFKHTTTSPWTDHPTHVAYAAIAQHIDADDDSHLSAGVYKLKTGGNIQLDQEITHDGREAILQVSRGLLAYSRYENYGSSGFISK